MEPLCSGGDGGAATLFVRNSTGGVIASASAGTRTRVPVRAAGPLPQARRVAGPPRRPGRRQGGAPGGPSVAAPRRPDGRVAALWPQLPEVDGRPAPSSWAGTGAGDRDGRGPLLYNRAPAPVIRRSARSLSSVPTPLPAHYWEIPITYKLSTGLNLPDGVVRLINLQGTTMDRKPRHMRQESCSRGGWNLFGLKRYVLLKLVLWCVVAIRGGWRTGS